MAAGSGWMRLLRTWSMPVLGLLACAAPAATQASPRTERLHVVILHTNDVHGQALPRRATWISKEDPPMVGGLARLAEYVNAEREEAKRSGEAVVVVDAGDWYQGTPEGLVDQGLGFASALSLVGYDAMCIGNHEFDRGIENVIRILKGSGVPAVCANLQVAATHKPVDWVPPWRIVEARGRNGDSAWTVRIGAVGLLTSNTPEITSSDVRSLAFTDPAAALERARGELAGKVDWVLPITHLGVEADRELARSFPDLPLIVGGHSHTLLKEGVLEGTTHIVQTGSKATAIGRVDAWLDPGTKAVVEMQTKVVDLTGPESGSAGTKAVEAACKKLEQENAERMKEVVGSLTKPVSRAPFARAGRASPSSSSAGNLVTDALREHSHADVGMMNRGGIRSDLEPGEVTRRAVFEILPFENSITVVTMTGAELTELLRRAVEGTAHSGLEISGAEVEVGGDSNAGRSVLAVRVGGKPVDTAASYRVAMNSFMAAGGDAYLSRETGSKREDDPTLMYEMLERHFTKHREVTPSLDDRYIVR